ncbi:MAG: hypothetical protein HYV93_05325 [Candidatus Rokubacteria bacterium]|nr:hypothetical protein [Candidatus Rokubacteria bacterium]
MKTWALGRPPSGSALIRQFAILSLLVVALITAALSVVLSYALRRDLLEREWGFTADYVRTEAQQHLAPGDFAAPATAEAQEHFRTFYHQTVMMPEIARVKIYDAGMAVIWSDEPRLIGLRFPENPHLVSALGGRTMINLEAGEKKGEHLFEREGFPQLVEVYVPVVYRGDARVVGVIETYKVPERVFASIRKAQLAVVGTALGGGTGLYVSLFWIVRRAARRIESQHEALEQRSHQLGAANVELRAVQAQLVAAERMAAVGEVVTAVAHGIRNPLANIRASAQVALLDCGDCQAHPAGPRGLTSIMAEVDRLEARLKELLQFVRPAERRSARVEVNAVVQRSLEMLAAHSVKAGVGVAARLAPELPPVTGDAILLEEVFGSLIGNAIDAAASGGGTVSLRSGATRDEAGAPQVFVEVRDSGAGIPDEDLAKIFEPFYTTKAQGTGLGLALARKFTQAHGGKITVRSLPGEGATFRVVLPVAAEA